MRVIQTWYSRTQLKQSIEEIKAHLRIFRDERGNELLDLPDAAFRGHPGPASSPITTTWCSPTPTGDV